MAPEACDLCQSIWVHMREPIQVQQAASECYHTHRERRQSHAAKGKKTTKDELLLVGGSQPEKPDRAKLSRPALAMALCVAVMALVRHISSGMEFSRSNDPTVSCPPLMFSTAQNCELCTVCSDEEVIPCLLGHDTTCASWSLGWSDVAHSRQDPPPTRRDAVTWTSLDQTMLFMLGGALDISTSRDFSEFLKHDGCEELSDEAPIGRQWMWGDFWVYNRNNSIWSQLRPPTLPQPREGAVSWIDTHGVAYVFGGGDEYFRCGSAADNLLNGFFFRFETAAGWQQQRLRKFRDAMNHSGFNVTAVFDPMPRSYAAVAMHENFSRLATLRPLPTDGRERTCLGHLFGGIISRVRNCLNCLSGNVRRSPADHWMSGDHRQDLGDLWEFECRRALDGSTEVIWTLQYHHENPNGPNHKKCTLLALSLNWTGTEPDVQTHAETAELSARVYECLFSQLPLDPTSWPRPRIKHAAWTTPCGSTSCYYIFGGSAAAGSPARQYSSPYSRPSLQIVDVAEQIVDVDSRISDLLSDLWQLRLESSGVSWAYLGGDTVLEQAGHKLLATSWPSPCRSMVAWTDGSRVWLYGGAVSDGVSSKQLVATDHLWRLELPSAPVRVSRVRRVADHGFSDSTGPPVSVTAVHIERKTTNALQWPRARFGASAWLIHGVGGELQLLGYGGSGSECAHNDGLLPESALESHYSNCQTAPLHDDFVRIIGSE